MAEEQQNDQQQDQQDDQQSSSQNSQQRQNTQRQDSGHMVPSHRLTEESKKRRDAETKLQKLESEREQAEEQRANQQGGYQKLAETRKATIENKDARIKELESQLLTGERYRAFVSASQGIVLPEALDDAFGMISEEEFKNADPSDTNTYRVLADQLVERKPYLTDGVRGSGSGGSARSVFSRQHNAAGNGKRKGSPFGKATEKPPFR